jgi:hypothetical protein
VNEKELRRVETPVRVKSEELKLVDAASLLMRISHMNSAEIQ